MDNAFWQGIVDADYAVPAEHTLADLTPELLTLLGSTDAHLRDVIAYPIFERWIARDLYTPAERRALARQLGENLKQGLGEQGTDTVFVRTFSALVLAELVYRHNQHPFFEEAELRQLLEQALAYYLAERDVRGFVPGAGWAHSSAHGADLLFVLAESSYLTAPDLERIMQALATKIAPPVAHIYLYNEDQRITRAVLSVLKRDLLSLSFLSTWLDGLTLFEGQKISFDRLAGEDPQIMPSETSMCVLYNTRQFLAGLYVHLLLDEQPPAVATEFAPLVLAALQPMNQW